MQTYTQYIPAQVWTIPWLWIIPTAKGCSPVLPALLKSTEDYTKMVRRKIVCSVWIISVSVSDHVFLHVATQKHLLYCSCSKCSFYCCWQAITSQQNNAFIGIFCEVCISWEVLTYYSKTDKNKFRRRLSCLQIFSTETWPEILLVSLGRGNRIFCSLGFFWTRQAGNSYSSGSDTEWNPIAPGYTGVDYPHSLFIFNQKSFQQYLKHTNIHTPQEHSKGRSMKKICQSIRHISDWACPLMAAQAPGNVHCNLSTVQHFETEINRSLSEKTHENMVAIKALAGTQLPFSKTLKNSFAMR